MKGKCQVCFLLIKTIVKMCPSCSALFCQSCIDQFTEPRCPTCRTPKYKNDYVRNRPVEESNQEVSHELCQIHSFEKSYFCMESGCKVALCPDCYIEGHMGHKKRRVKSMFDECISEIDKAIEPHKKAVELLKAQKKNIIERTRRITRSEKTQKATLKVFTNQLL